MVLAQHPRITMSSTLLGISPGPTTAPSDGTKEGDLLTHRSDPGCNLRGREKGSLFPGWEKTKSRAPCIACAKHWR